MREYLNRRRFRPRRVKQLIRTNHRYRHEIRALEMRLVWAEQWRQAVIELVMASIRGGRF